MSSKSPNSSIKRITKKSSLKRRLSGIFLLDTEPKSLTVETTLEKPESEKTLDTTDPSEAKQAPTRSFFSFPSYLKKVKTRTIPLNTEVETIEPQALVATDEVETLQNLDTEISTPEPTTIPTAENVTPTPQLAYKISLQKLQESSRRPLIQVLFIHQTITEATSKLRKEGIHPMQLMHEQRLSRPRGFNAPIPQRRTYPARRRSPPPPYSPAYDSVPDQEDDVPLALLQKEFMKPTTTSVLVV